MQRCIFLLNYMFFTLYVLQIYVFLFNICFLNYMFLKLYVLHIYVVFKYLDARYVFQSIYLPSFVIIVSRYRTSLLYVFRHLFGVLT